MFTHASLFAICFCLKVCGMRTTASITTSSANAMGHPFPWRYALSSDWFPCSPAWFWKTTRRISCKDSRNAPTGSWITEKTSLQECVFLFVAAKQFQNSDGYLTNSFLGYHRSHTWQPVRETVICWLYRHETSSSGYCHTCLMRMSSYRRMESDHCPR